MADGSPLDDWDLEHASRCFVHVLNSLQYAAATGHKPPIHPPTAADYTRAGLPWFDYYGAESTALEGAVKLANLDSVAAKTIKQGVPPMDDNEPIQPEIVKAFGPGGVVIREGEFRTLRHNTHPLAGQAPGRPARLVGFNYAIKYINNYALI